MKKTEIKNYTCPECGETITREMTYFIDSDEPNYMELLESIENQENIVCEGCQNEGQAVLRVTYVDKKHNYRIVYANEDKLIRETMVTLEKHGKDGMKNRVIPNDYGMFLARIKLIDRGYDDLALYLYQGILLKNAMDRMDEEDGLESMAIRFDYESNDLGFEFNSEFDTYEYAFNKEEYEKVLNSNTYNRLSMKNHYLVDDKLALLALFHNMEEPTHKRFFFNKTIRVYVVNTEEGEVKALSSYNLPVGAKVYIASEGKAKSGTIIDIEEINEFDFLVKEEVKEHIIDLSIEMDRATLESHMEEVIFKQNELNHDHLCISGLEIPFRPNELDAIEPGDIISNEEDIISFYPIRGKSAKTRVYIFGTEYEFQEGKMCLSHYKNGTKFFVVDKYKENETKVLYLLQLHEDSWLYYGKDTLELVRKQEEIYYGYNSIENRLYEENNVGYVEEYDVDMNRAFEVNHFVDHNKITKVLSNLEIK